MRHLLLLRHARAERLRSGGRDRDRALEESGRADARSLGPYLARHRLIPDRALVSAAVRTRETFALLAQGLKPAPAAQYDESLYDAAPEAILDAIRQHGAGAARLLVIGHNPSLQELAAVLIAAGDIDARQRLKEKFPPAALAVIGFAGGEWRDLRPHTGRLEHFVTPDQLMPTTE
jgi:phosphohistidine phosphatase